MNKKKQVLNQSVLILLIMGILAVLGLAYTMNNSYTPNSGALIEIRNPPEGARYYIDNKIATPDIRNATRAVIDSIDPGERILIVHVDGKLPWAKNLSLLEGVTTEVSPFNMPLNPEIEIIPEYLPDENGTISNTAYDKLIAQFPSSSSTILSYNSSVQASYENTSITAAWLGSQAYIPYFFCVLTSCDVVFTVLNAESPIRSIAFFPRRDDVILFATQNVISAIELDRNGTQNFQPIYTGTQPDFVISEKDENTLLIKDGNALMRLSL